MEMSFKLLRSLKTLTLPNFVTPVSIANLMCPSMVLSTP